MAVGRERKGEMVRGTWARRGCGSKSEMSASLERCSGVCLRASRMMELQIDCLHDLRVLAKIHPRESDAHCSSEAVRVVGTLPTEQPRNEIWGTYVRHAWCGTRRCIACNSLD